MTAPSPPPAPEPDYYYLCRPAPQPPEQFRGVERLSVAEFLADEPACRTLWQMIDTQFRTRHKFLAIWRTTSYVFIQRGDSGAVDGLLLVSAPVNWQIDYVVVRPEARGRGVAGRLVRAAVDAAAKSAVPYVMLTSRPGLRPLYESCGFTVVATSLPAAGPT